MKKTFALLLAALFCLAPLTVCADGMTAVLHADCTCTVSGGEAPQEVPQTSVSQTGDILTVACGTTVSGFKTAHADVLAVTDADDEKSV